MEGNIVFERYSSDSSILISPEENQKTAAAALNIFRGWKSWVPQKNKLMIYDYMLIIYLL